MTRVTLLGTFIFLLAYLGSASGVLGPLQFFHAELELRVY